MFEKLGIPDFVRRARAESAGKQPFVEILLFCLVFFVGSFVQSILTMPFMFISLLQQADALRYAVETEDLEALLALTEQVSQSVIGVLGSLFATAGLIFVALLYCRLIEKRSFASMGLTHFSLAESLRGAVVGLLLFGACVGFALLFGKLSFTGLSAKQNIPFLILALVGFLIQGFSEELLCRGYLMTSLSREMPLPAALIFTALLFTFLHTANVGFGLFAMLNIFLFGILSGLYFIRRGNLWGAAVLHGLWNFAEGPLCGLPVSGLLMPASLFGFSTEGASAFVSGGSFGPESGLAATFALVIGIVLLLMQPTKTTAEKQ